MKNPIIPSIIIKYNIDYTTCKNGELVKNLQNKKIGYIPKILYNLIEMYKNVDNFESDIIKGLINQVYGIIGCEKNRNYLPCCYVVPIILGEINSKIRSMTKDIGLKVLHQNCDRTYLQMEHHHSFTHVFETLKEIVPDFVSFSYDYIPRFLLLGKFKYCHQITEEPYVFYKGLSLEVILNI